VSIDLLLDNSKCDVWSIGVIAYMLLSGTPPFYGKNDDETFAAVRRGKWRFCEPEFRSVSAQGKAFIIACLTRRVEARPSADVASRHPWFNLLKTAKEPSASSISIDVIERCV
jgi:serine/threonine protein kinase